MQLNGKIQQLLEKEITLKVMTNLVSIVLKYPKSRNFLINSMDKAFYKKTKTENNRPKKVLEDRYYMARALLTSLNKILNSSSISKETIEKFVKVFLSKVFINAVVDNGKNFKEKYGFRPPGFVTISPTNVCNLKCVGCYAGDIYKKHTLSYDVLNWVVNQMKREFNSHFFVISGGEPFMYKSQRKTLLDLFEEHDDCFFMAYTNGTLITEAIAKKLAKLGNFTPAISVEGFSKETDLRRGKGVHKKIIETMKRLKKLGVVFGISVTPTKNNADLLLSDKFIDFFFNKMGAFYGWYFQYMPIGRKPCMDLMVTPEQRSRMREKIWDLVRRERVFIADFWNSGTASDGCISAARGGGYFYIMWDGTITPCVFIPFKDRHYGNVYDLYKNNKTLSDAINSLLFKAIRNWQSGYWYNQPAHRCGNLLVPCIIRDNSSAFYKIIKQTGAIPVDEGAKQYLKLIEQGKMPCYNEEYKKLVSPVWDKEYLKKPHQVSVVQQN